LTIKIYHNPSCSKSRQTLQLLADKNIEPQIIEYLNTPPSKQELIDILTLLALSPRQLIRSTEKIFSELNLDNPNLSDEELIDAMLANPILIQRPIVIANGKAAIGRPPETIVDILFKEKNNNG